MRLSFLLLFTCLFCEAQEPLKFQKAIGWNYFEAEVYYSMHGSPTPDGGHILAGTIGGTAYPFDDLMLAKTDKGGELQWVKLYDCYGTRDYGNDVITTLDGGFLAVGTTHNNLDSTEQNVLVIKTDALGNMQWAGDYGDVNLNYGQHAVELPGGGYVISGVGYSGSFIMRIAGNGSVVWAKNPGGIYLTPNAMVVLPDTSVALVGTYYSNLAVVRLSLNGDTLWSRGYGGNQIEDGAGIALTPDGNLLAVGSTSSFGAGSVDCYVLKLNLQGDIVWSGAFGGIDIERAYSVNASHPNQYVIAGSTSSFGAGNSDVYAFATDSTGALLWSRTYGGTQQDLGSCVIPAADGGYIITGETYSFGNGWNDHYLIKADSVGNALCHNNAAPTVSSPTFTVSTPGMPVLNVALQTYSITPDTFNIAPDLLLTQLCTNLFSVNITKSDASCEDTCNGQAFATVNNGIGPFQYFWSTGGTSASLTGLCSGTYYVTVTDAVQDTAVDSVNIISYPDQMSLVTNVLSYDDGNCNGSAKVVVVNGDLPFAFQWDDPNNQTTATATGLCEGTYQVTVVDGDFCIDTAVVFIYISGFSENIMDKTITVHPNPTDGFARITNIGQGTTNVEVFDLFGRPVPHVFNIQNSTLSIEGQPAGVYFVRIGESVVKLLKQ